MPGGTGRADDILNTLENYLAAEEKLKKINVEDVKNRIETQLEKTFKEEIIPLIKSLTSSEKEYLLKQVNRIRKRGKSGEKLEEIGNMIDTQINNEKLYGIEDAILNDLEKNYVTVHENQEMMGYKGKIVEITLPKVGNFGGYSFEYFVSNDEVEQDEFERNPELEEKSYSMKDVGGLLLAMNKYMQAMGVETDGDVDYENDLKVWETKNYRCDAGDCLKQITGLYKSYWLKDKYLDGACAHLDCHGNCCTFCKGYYNSDRLFLRPS